MATDVTASRAKPYRLDVGQFLKMIEAGVFPRDAHVELLGGRLLRMMTKGDPHDSTVDTLGEGLRAIVPAGWIVREDKSLQLNARSRPEPDLAIVRGPRSQFQNRTPQASEAAVVVEVADSSYAYDRGLKWRGYASAGIPAYWIVNLPKRQVEVYTNPTGRGQKASYQDQAIFDVRASVPLIVMGSQVGQVAVRDILP